MTDPVRPVAAEVRAAETTASDASPPIEPAPAPPERGTRLRALAASFAAVALAACGGGGGGGGSGTAPPPPTVPPPPPPPPPPSSPTGLDPADTAAARFLQQAGLASTTTDIAAVKAGGAAAWLDAQFALPLGQTSWDWLASKGYSAIDEYRFYDGNFYFDLGVSYQLIKSPDMVRKRVSLALSELFVVSNVGLTMPWSGLAISHYWDQLNANAFGNFRQLLEAVTLNPAMGLYLNTKGNAKEDAASGRVPDENYAREVMQLFTIGLVKLNTDGTPMLDGAGQPIPTYGQGDVSNLARVFTGWDWWDDGLRFPSANDGYPRPYPEYTRRAMVLSPSLHSTLAATFLGRTIPAGTDGTTALGLALDTLFQHPNVGPFFARQMIQRLVTSQPSTAYVGRVAAAFNDNGSGVRGDLKAVWRAILLDAEATGAASLASATHGKVREPMLRLYQWARTFNLTSAAGTYKWGLPYGDPVYWYEQRPFGSPSVFNFFRPGYVPPGTALATTSSTSPEFQIVNESTVAQWVNLLETVTYQGMYIVWPTRPGYPDTYAGPYPGDGYDMTPDHAAELAIAHDAPALVQRLNLILAAGQLSAETQASIASILSTGFPMTPATLTEYKRGRIGAALQMVMSMPEYIVQK